MANRMNSSQSVLFLSFGCEVGVNNTALELFATKTGGKVGRRVDAGVGEKFTRFWFRIKELEADT